MKIPLTASVQKGEEEEKEKLVIYSNGKQTKIDLPFSPFILAESSQFPEFQGTPEEWIKVPQHQPTDYFRINFQTNNACFDFIKKYKDRKRYIFNNGYIDQLLISHPVYFLQYPHTLNLKIMFFDIEVATRGDGFFPRPVSNEVLCIGYSIWEYTNIGEKKKLKHIIIKGFTEELKDSTILTEFKQAIINEDPDIIAGYNSELFDFPYLIERYELMHIDMTGIGRNGRKPYIYQGQIVIPGRIHFDVFSSNAGVTKDQTLSGIKSKTLKDLARFYKIKIEDIELPNEIANLIKLFKENPERLYGYQSDDVLRTEHVGNVYLRNCITLAEMIGSPLSSIINMFSSFIPKIIIAREMESLRLMNTETNFQKYNSVNGSLAKFRKYDGKELKYQGALVGIYQIGFFEDVHKIDFSSMYPSAIETWDLGPDTTSLVEVRPYTGKYKFSKDSKYNWYSIPDKNFNCDVLVKVRNDKDGFLKTKISTLKAERKKIKKELKSCPPDQYEMLYSQQNAIKVILNSIYGYFGLKTSIYGDMISGMMVTAMCRWTTTNVIQWLHEDLIELDTDGLILDKPVDDKKINEDLTNLIKERFQLDKNYMQMELEHFGRAYFYAMKNYIVEEDGKYIKHGVSMKSSKVAKVVDRAVDLGIEHWFNNKPKEEVIREAYNFKGLGLEWFEERVKLSKEQVDYDDQTDMKLLLAKQMEMKTGQICEQGTQINYYITRDQLPFKELRDYYKKTSSWNYTFAKYVDSIKDLNLSYYEKMIDKVLDRFDIYRVEQTDFLSALNIQKETKRKLDTVPMEKV